jgi:ankyrin repeat protein
LKATSEWIAEHKPLDLPPGKKTRRSSPLQIAIEKGFLILTEVLLDGGADPLGSNGNALAVAVDRKRTDIVRLLLDRGVPVGSVRFESVCYSGDSELIQLFLVVGVRFPPSLKRLRLSCLQRCCRKSVEKAFNLPFSEQPNV